MKRNKTIKNSIDDILKNKLDYIFLFFQFLVFVGPIRQFSSDSFLFINLFLIIVLSIYKNRFKITEFFFAISIIYFLLSVIPIIFFGLDFKLYAGFYIRLITAYFILQYFRIRFLVLFENLIFILALISLPLFVIQLINPSFFNVFTGVSQVMLYEEYLTSTHQYMFIFFFNGWAVYRNSGFAWEPAAFGAILSWAILFNLFINNFSVNLKTIVLLIAALTTFSVGTYSYILLLSLVYFYERKIQNGILLTFSSIILYFAVMNLPLFKNNLEMMNRKITVQQTDLLIDSEADNIDVTKVSRIAGITVNLKLFLKWPWGYGFSDNEGERKYLGASPNGLMILIVRWGIGGICIMLLSMYKLALTLKYLYHPSLRKFNLFLCMIVYIIPLSGNPFYNKPMVLALLMFPFMTSRYITYYLQRHKSFLSGN